MIGVPRSWSFDKAVLALDFKFGDQAAAIPGRGKMVLIFLKTVWRWTKAIHQLGYRVPDEPGSNECRRWRPRSCHRCRGFDRSPDQIVRIEVRHQVTRSLLDTVGIPPQAIDQLQAMAWGDGHFDFGTFGLEAVDSAGTLRVGQRAETSVDAKSVGYVNVVKILDAGDGWCYVTIVGEKDRFLQIKVNPSETNRVSLPVDFPSFKYLPEIHVPDPVIR